MCRTFFAFTMRTKLLLMVFFLEYLGIEARPQISSFSLLRGSTSWEMGEPRLLPDMTEILPRTQPNSDEKLKSPGFSYCNKLLTLNPQEVFTLSIPVDGKSCLIYIRAPKGYLLEQRSRPIVWFAGCDKEQLRFSNGPHTMVYCDGGYQLNFHGNQDYVAIMYQGVTRTYRQVIKLAVSLKPEASRLPGSKKDTVTGIGEIVWRDPENDNAPKAALERARQDGSLQICPQSCGASNNDDGAYSLVFGAPAGAGELPYMARIVVIYKTPGRQNVFTTITCGGTILNSRHILTAAHCLLDREKQRWEVIERSVYAADIDANEDQEVNFDHFTIHPEFKARIQDGITRSYRAYDIAVVKLPYDLRLGPNSWPICLAPGLDFTNQRATTSSFGQITRDDPDGLWKAGVVIADYDTRCRQFDRFKSAENLYRKTCTFGMAKDTCHGDAGSPVAVSEGSVWYQVGVASGGYCVRPGEPHFHVNVTTFADFIRQNVQSGNCR